MPFNKTTGLYDRVHRWRTDRDNSVKILASRMDEEFDALKAALDAFLTGTGAGFDGLRGPIRTSFGTAAAPSHSFRQDPDSGMYRSNVNEVSIATEGAQRLVVSKSKLQYAGNKVWHEGNDGAGSGLDADTIDGMTPAQVAALLPAASVLSKLKGVDGAGSGLDADTIDGMTPAQVAALLPASSVLSKLETVDGTGSGLDADLLDGKHGSEFLDATKLAAEIAKIPKDLAGTSRGAEIGRISITVPANDVYSDPVGGGTAHTMTLTAYGDAVKVEVARYVPNSQFPDTTLKAGINHQGFRVPYDSVPDKALGFWLVLYVDGKEIARGMVPLRPILRNYGPTFAQGAGGAIIPSLEGLSRIASGSDATRVSGWLEDPFATTLQVLPVYTNSKLHHQLQIRDVNNQGQLSWFNTTNKAQALRFSFYWGVASGSPRTFNVNLGSSPALSSTELLSKLKTVDGAGSGLDADLLDGMTPAQLQANAVTAANTGEADRIRQILKAAGSSGVANIVTLSASRAYTADEVKSLNNKVIHCVNRADITVSFGWPGGQDVIAFEVVNASPTDASVHLTAASARRDSEPSLEAAGERAVVVTDLGTDARFEFSKLSAGQGSSAPTAPVVHEIDSSGFSSDTTVDLNIQTYWEEWKNRTVFLALSDAASHTVNVNLRPSASGEWLPDVKVHEQTFTPPNKVYFAGSTSVTIDYIGARGERPEVTVAALLPGDGKRFINTVRVYRSTDPEAGKLQLILTHNRSEGIGSQNSDDLSDDFEENGFVTVTNGGDSITFHMNNQDSAEPYLITHTSKTEVNAWADRMANTLTGAGSFSITLGVTSEDATGKPGDAIRFVKAWQGGDFRVTNMGLAKPTEGGYEVAAKVNAAAVVSARGHPIGLSYIKEFGGSSSYPWLLDAVPEGRAVMVDVAASGQKLDLQANWNNWKGRRVLLVAGSNLGSATAIIEATASKHTERQLMTFAGGTTGAYKRGGTTPNTWVAIEPAKGSRPEITNTEIRDGSTRAYLGRVLYRENNTVEVVIVNSQQADIPARGVETANANCLPLKSTFLDNGEVYFHTTSGRWMRGGFGGSANFGSSSPYIFTPNNMAFSDENGDNVYTLAAGDPTASDGATKTLLWSTQVTTPTTWNPPDEDIGESVEFVPLWEGAIMVVSGLSVAVALPGGGMKGYNGGDARPTGGLGIPLSLTYVKGAWADASKRRWLARTEGTPPSKGRA